jgi:predicted nucleotidyltransferase
MRWTLSALRQRRDEILEIARRHGARSVRVFGSIARGEAGPESDVDLVVEYEPGTSLMDHGELIMDLEAALGCRVDAVSAGGMGERMRSRVESEAVAL